MGFYSGFFLRVYKEKIGWPNGQDWLRWELFSIDFNGIDELWHAVDINTTDIIATVVAYRTSK